MKNKTDYEIFSAVNTFLGKTVNMDLFNNLYDTIYNIYDPTDIDEIKNKVNEKFKDIDFAWDIYKEYCMYDIETATFAIAKEEFLDDIFSICDILNNYGKQ